MAATITVLVDDNFHYMDKSERYELGKFDDLATAIATCQRAVNEFLAEAHEPGMTAGDLYQSYKNFGPDPFIVGVDGVPFSAWDYAKARCLEICNSQSKGAS